MTTKLEKKGLIDKEELPGGQLQSDEQLRENVRYNACGHYASCSCAIGPREVQCSTASRVHGMEGLRVVDASLFPRIPRLFIVSAVYMIGEKAADSFWRLRSEIPRDSLRQCQREHLAAIRVCAELVDHGHEVRWSYRRD
jgi:choline dehydrogenase-like flavoprotein